jgi:hypothetical protein
MPTMLLWRLFRFLLPLAASVGWAWLIFWLSVDPSPAGADATREGGFLAWLPRADLFAHFGVYAILAFFLRWSFGWLHTWRPFESAIKNGLPVIIAGIYGAGLELLQETIDERAGEIADAAADTLGALVMVWVLSYALPRATQRTRTLVARLG